MNGKFVSWAFALGLVLASQFPVASIAQSTDDEAYRKQIEQAKVIVRRLKAEKRLTAKEFSILDGVLSQAGRVLSPDVDAGKKSNPTAASASPELPAVSEKQDLKRRQLARDLFTYPLPQGKVYMYTVDLNTNYLRTFWQDQRQRPYQSIEMLQEDQFRAGYRLKFAINGGIFSSRYAPKGLYIEEGKVLFPLDEAQPGGRFGNFYMEPNGVFMVAYDKTARILTTQEFIKQFQGKPLDSIRLAVQSGPTMLLHGKINKEFTKDSANKLRRTGVGIVDEHRVVFGMSSGSINFRDFATLFADMGCSDALFLDGGPISSMYVENQLKERAEAELVTILGVTEKESQ